jgi:hypothetical protein
MHTICFACDFHCVYSERQNVNVVVISSSKRKEKDAKINMAGSWKISEAGWGIPLPQDFPLRILLSYPVLNFQYSARRVAVYRKGAVFECLHEHPPGKEFAESRADLPCVHARSTSAPLLFFGSAYHGLPWLSPIQCAPYIRVQLGNAGKFTRELSESSSRQAR